MNGPTPSDVSIEMVGHAGLLLTAADCGLMMDPWLSGFAFERGWELLSAAVFADTDWERVTHIWFSHEHPDHFSVPTLRGIPEEHRARITVLFQTTRDRRVAKFCEKFFAKVVEVEDGEPYQIGSVEVRCQPHTNGDSMLWIKAGDFRMLNVNDCVFENDHQIKRLLEQFGAVDLLASQFSYANWCGSSKSERKAYAGSVADSLVNQTKLFGADTVIPFASFVWFCHVENKYLNDSSNDIGDIADRLEKDTPSQVAVLYPGDHWTPQVSAGELITQNRDAISRYRADVVAKQDGEPSQRSDAIDLDTLETLGGEWFDTMQSAFPTQLKALHKLGYLRTVRLGITDHGADVELRPDGRPTIKRSDPSIPTELDLTSDALRGVFQNSFGGMALGTNGRFTTTSATGYRYSLRMFHLAEMSGRELHPFAELGSLVVSRVRSKAEGLSRR